MTILISILLAFLLLCFITYIDFQIWYKKQKREENPYWKVIPHNYLQLTTQTIKLDGQYQLAEAQAELQKEWQKNAGQIIMTNGLDEIEILTGGIN